MILLENNKIRLRALEPEDLEVLYRWENDSMLWKNGDTVSPYSRYSLKQYINHSHEGIYEQKQMRLVVELKENKEAIGVIDLYNLEVHHQKVAVGILIDKKYQSKGFAKDTIKLIIDYCFKFLKLHQIYAYIAIDNEASRKLFTHCGFTQTGLLKDWIITPDGDYTDVLFMQKLSETNS